MMLYRVKPSFPPGVPPSVSKSGVSYYIIITPARSQ